MVAGAPYEEPCTPEIFEQAKHNLRNHFSVVGLSERFEDSLALMKIRYGWKLDSYHSFNITRSRARKRELPQAILDLIADKNSFDIAFVQLCEQLFQKSVEQNAAAVNSVVQTWSRGGFATRSVPNYSGCERRRESQLTEATLRSTVESIAPRYSPSRRPGSGISFAR